MFRDGQQEVAADGNVVVRKTACRDRPPAAVLGRPQTVINQWWALLLLLLLPEAVGKASQAVHATPNAVLCFLPTHLCAVSNKTKSLWHRSCHLVNTSCFLLYILGATQRLLQAGSEEME